MKTSALLTSLLLSGLISTAMAATDEDIARLRADLAALSQRIAALEAENQTLKTQKTTDKKSWTETAKLKGDLRYRYEYIDAEGSDRERQRIRARAQLTLMPADNLELGLAIASGDDDPRSTNQTLGGGGSSKGLQLDRAYFKWQARPGVTLLGGKMNNAWHRAGGHGLLWDSDYTPEGFHLALAGDSLFLNAGLNFLESDTSAGNDPLIMYGLQGGFNRATGVGTFKAGVSYFDFGTRGRGTYYGDDFYGNSSRCTSACSYAFDYQELEVFAELGTEFGSLPATLFVDYVQNQDAKNADSGWAGGITLHDPARASWELGYVYQDLAADAALGLLIDADFGGGSTDVKGHLFKGGLSLSKQWQLSFHYFVNQRQVDTGNREDYDRLQVNSVFQF